MQQKKWIHYLTKFRTFSHTAACCRVSQKEPDLILKSDCGCTHFFRSCLWNFPKSFSCVLRNRSDTLSCHVNHSTEIKTRKKLKLPINCFKKHTSQCNFLSVGCVFHRRCKHLLLLYSDIHEVTKSYLACFGRVPIDSLIQWEEKTFQVLQTHGMTSTNHLHKFCDKSSKNTKLVSSQQKHKLKHEPRKHALIHHLYGIQDISLFSGIWKKVQS